MMNDYIIHDYLASLETRYGKETKDKNCKTHLLMVEGVSDKEAYSSIFKVAVVEKGEKI